ncbi:MAG: M15 family metallopeptidase [Sinomicrobium sp.]|nr:M15 family metallopeptidase [Sinomicrobium sp.]
MNRRRFTIASTLTGITVMGLPGLAFGMQQYSEAELTGKGNPELYGGRIGLKKEAYRAFLAMKTAALKEGIRIKVVSGYRSFDRQKSIWEQKYNAFTAQGASPAEAIREIIAYSTIPGTSRHHWGTDIDIIDDNAVYEGDVLVPEKFDEGQPFFKLKKWLDDHAAAFGFYLVYTDNPDRKGFNYEPWHYSYAPVSIPMLKAYRKLDVKKILRQESLSGSSHFTAAFTEQYIRENILDINPVLLQP